MQLAVAVSRGVKRDLDPHPPIELPSTLNQEVEIIILEHDFKVEMF